MINIGEKYWWKLVIFNIYQDVQYPVHHSHESPVRDKGDVKFQDSTIKVQGTFFSCLKQKFKEYKVKTGLSLQWFCCCLLEN